MSRTGSILTLNAGSSSVKFALFDAGRDLHQSMRGEIESLSSVPHFHAVDDQGRVLIERRWEKADNASYPHVIEELLTFIESHLGKGGLAAVGHRIVHGGEAYSAPVKLTPKTIDAIEALTPLDPLHLPLNVAPIRAVAEARPKLTQVACFDTAFHHTIPKVAHSYAIPRELSDKGLRAYGFHGLSYEYIAGQLKELAPDLAVGRVIIAHLGAGASLCALRNGQSIATTMGFSALDGLMMATRSGIIDPGVLLYLGRHGYNFKQIEDLLYHKSGLLGVSGISGDVRDLLASDKPEAREALDLFAYRLAWEIGALISALGGLDGLVFTAGIGEHSAEIRADVCARLAWLGLRLDAWANKAHAGVISLGESAVAVRVIPTNEEAMIAHHTLGLLQKG
ncbi:acetate/propionate family kinase [Acidisoma cellulosilytica]|uniref:Acetate kinase n=1 Tax=Acidisoma cellulosilyticum TaxID=2802395 RepID=A0A964E3X1_9PROT|nr:acetate/propionate family kinase [Acidisoma cellulosilyticum]MCB8880682.1 acetate/propionate family kinase [Acidisoma cellulosilyticum]